VRALPVPGEGDELVLPPALARVCALCLIRFRIGDQFTTVWPKFSRVKARLALVLHRRCYEQLDAGDLGRIYEGFERLLVRQLAALEQTFGPARGVGHA
jgi:hypothetical protein